MSLFRRAPWLLDRPYGGILQRSRVARNAEIPSALLRPLQPTTDRATRHRHLPRGGRTVTGLITERTASGAERPLAAQVGAWVSTRADSPYSYWWANGPRTSGGDGRYELTALPESARVIVQVYLARLLPTVCRASRANDGRCGCGCRDCSLRAGIGVTRLCHKQTWLPIHFWSDLRKHAFRPPAGSRRVCRLRAHG